MYEDMDSYLSCSLKNWAAQQHSPTEARERLLLLADSAGDQQNGAAHSRLFHREQDPASLRYAEQWAYGPFTQTRLWYFHTLSPAHLLA